MQNEKFCYPKISMKASGRKLRYICKRKYVSVLNIQRALCLGSNQAVYDWFNGKTMPTVHNLYALSKLLNVSMESLLVEEGREEILWNFDTPLNGLEGRMLEYRRGMSILCA